MSATLTTARVDDRLAKLTPGIDGDTVFFDRERCAELGRSLRDQYTANQPYPHIVLDDFLPKPVLSRVNEEFPRPREGRFSDAHSKLKTGYQMETIGSPYITNLMTALNSSQFIGFLEEMTGITGLIPDPHYTGGGLHETRRGGHLSIHVDFNVHKSLQLRRRMNLILFLNDQWEDDWGGQLEIWDNDMTACVHSVLPLIGRAVVFNTDPGSYHGHPDPLTTPENVTRRSIALYYYTAPEGGILTNAKSTEFRARPGTSDSKPSNLSSMKSLIKDLLPPIITRNISMKR